MCLDEKNDEKRVGSEGWMQAAGMGGDYSGVSDRQADEPGVLRAAAELKQSPGLTRGPESDAMDVVLKYWNENKAEEAGFYVEQELFGRDNIMLKEEALMAAKSSDVDLFFTASRWLGKYWMHMEPLQPYLDNPEINIYGADTEGRIPATVDGFRWLDGTLYGVPMDLSCTIAATSSTNC